MTSTRSGFITLRVRLNSQIHCRSRREEAQISDDLATNQGLLTPAPAILRHALRMEEALAKTKRENEQPPNPKLEAPAQLGAPKPKGWPHRTLRPTTDFFESAAR